MTPAKHEPSGTAAKGAKVVQDDGYVAHRHYKPSGSRIVIYRSAEQGLDVAERWAVVCDLHGVMCGARTRKLAWADMQIPEFCQSCMDAARAAESCEWCKQRPGELYGHGDGSRVRACTKCMDESDIADQYEPISEA